MRRPTHAKTATPQQSPPPTQPPCQEFWDPLADRVLNLFAETPGWRGTPSQLLSALNVDDNAEFRKGYKTARELSSNLRRLVPALRTLGVEVTFGKSGSQRWIRLDRVTPE